MTGNRIANDHSFECSRIKGMVLEQLIGFYEGDEANGIDILLVKVKEIDLWQRYFLDAGLGFWEEYGQESAFEDYEDLTPINIANKYGLKNSVVQKISCIGSNEELSSVHIEIDNTKLVLRFKDSKNLESETILEKL